MKMQCDIAVVGGGASGLIAALHARRMRPATDVLLLERQARVGRKLLATGNGRCNLTNSGAMPQNYHGDHALIAEALNRFPPRYILDYFEQMGLLCREEVDGRVYPFSAQAAAVLDALRMALDEAGGRVLCDCEVCSICSEADGFLLSSANGDQIRARCVILCAGGPASPSLGGGESGYALLRALGHRIVRPFPALTPLRVPAERVRALKGVRCACEIGLYCEDRLLRAERGELLFTEYGLSGIAAMMLARDAGEQLGRRKRVEARIRLLPWDAARIRSHLSERQQAMPNRALEGFLTGLVHKRLGQALLQQAGVGPLSRVAQSLTGDELDALAAVLNEWVLPVTGTQGFAQAQVTAGGADTAQFDPDTLQSKLVPGLFCAGELLNVDGDCGGYNLQWAWASGLMAAEGAVRLLI